MIKIPTRLLVVASFLILLAAAVVSGLQYFYVVPILNYHSVSPVLHSDTPAVSQEVFARQMEFIHRKGYQVISLDEYIQKRREGKKMQNTLVITFDDGYEDNYTHAFPVLKKYHFPATIFIIVKHLNKPRFLKLDQIREMEKENISFGSHTINHTYLPPLTDERELRSEIFDSKLLLEKATGSRVDYFCYPIGGYNQRIKELVMLAGYKAAMTTNRGPDRLNQDPYALKRIKLTQKNLPGFILWLKLSGYYLLFLGNRNPY